MRIDYDEIDGDLVQWVACPMCGGVTVSFCDKDIECEACTLCELTYFCTACDYEFRPEWSEDAIPF
jgi:hypothetical protein